MHRCIAVPERRLPLAAFFSAGEIQMDASVAPEGRVRDDTELNRGGLALMYADDRMTQRYLDKLMFPVRTFRQNEVLCVQATE